MQRTYVPNVRFNHPIDEEMIYRFVSYQIVKKMGRRRANQLEMEIRGNNVLNLFVIISGSLQDLADLPDPLFYEGWIEDYKRATPMASHKSKTPYIVMGLLVLLIGTAVWVKDAYQYEGYADVKTAVREANNSAEYWEFQDNHDLILHSPIARNFKMQAGNLLRKCTDVPKAAFLLSVKDQFAKSAFLFDSEKYTIDIGGDPTKINNFNVCNVIEQRLDVKNHFLELFRQMKITVPVYKLPVEGVPVGELAIELVYMVAKLVRAYGSCVEVLVKGYADGQDGDWKHSQEKDYYYPEISIYPKASNTGFEFNHVRTQVRLPSDGSYTNKDLPNLRARFVQKELIERSLSSCKGLPNVTSQILEGHEFKQKNPSDRKVQIFVVLF